MERTGLQSKEADNRKAFFMKMREASVKKKNTSTTNKTESNVPSSTSSTSKTPTSSSNPGSFASMRPSLSTTSTTATTMKPSSSPNSSSKSEVVKTDVNRPKPGSFAAMMSNNSSSMSSSSSSNALQKKSQTSNSSSNRNENPLDKPKPGSFAAMRQQQSKPISSEIARSTEPAKNQQHDEKSSTEQITDEKSTSDALEQQPPTVDFSVDTKKLLESLQKPVEPQELPLSTVEAKPTKPKTPEPLAEKNSENVDVTELKKSSQESHEIQVTSISRTAFHQSLHDEISSKLVCETVLICSKDMINICQSLDEKILHDLSAQCLDRGVNLRHSDLTNTAQLEDAWHIARLDKTLSHLDTSDIVVMIFNHEDDVRFPTNCFDQLSSHHSWAASKATTCVSSIFLEALRRKSTPTLLFLVTSSQSKLNSSTSQELARIQVAHEQGTSKVLVKKIECSNSSTVTTTLHQHMNQQLSLILPEVLVERDMASVSSEKLRQLLSSTVIGRDDEIDQITKAFESPNNTIVTIHGQPGVGKSAVLTSWINQRAQSHPNDVILYHSFSSSSGAARITVAMTSLIMQLKPQTDALALPLFSPTDMVCLFFEILEQFIVDILPADAHLILAIDDIDLAKEENEDDASTGWVFDFPVAQAPWLPRILPQSTKLVTSCRSKSAAHSMFMKKTYDCVCVEIGNLSQSAAEKIRLKWGTASSTSLMSAILSDVKLAKRLDDQQNLNARRLEVTMHLAMLHQPDLQAQQEHFQLVAECRTLAELCALALLCANDVVQPVVDDGPAAQIYTSAKIHSDDELATHALRVVLAARNGLTDMEWRSVVGLRHSNCATLFTILRDALQILVVDFGGKYSLANDSIRLMIKDKFPENAELQRALADLALKEWQEKPNMLARKHRIVDELPHRGFAKSGQWERFIECLENQSYTKVLFGSGTLDLPMLDIDADVAEKLETPLKKNSFLTRLNLDNNILGKFGASAVGKISNRCSQLTMLNLGNNMIKDEGLDMLLQGLDHASNVTHLFLRVNGISKQGAQALGEYLQEDSSLKDLNLDGNEIGAEGASHLSSGLENNITLKSLNLMFNNLGDDGAAHISLLLKRNQTIQVGLRGNGISKTMYAVFPKT